ncbi:helix-turn-helix domain-containing protein [Aquimarina macrocephali]|uniref:helix-turn-helix domain-containing protein n=1 Tax=Aquimarina macrocephali TaxID=666563 RepID=UPI003F6814B4
MKSQIILFLFFAFLGVLISLLFLKKQGDRFANRILVIYTLLSCYEIIYNCLRWSGKLYTIEYVHLNMTHFPLWLIYGPLVYIYVRRVIFNTTFKKSDILFVIPILILILLLSPFYFLSAQNKYDTIVNNTVNDYILLPSYGIWIIIVFMIFYGGFTYQKFKKSTNVGYKEKNWLHWFIGAYFGFVFLFTLYIFLIRFEIMDAQYDYFIDIGIVFFVGVLVYFGFVQPDVFSGKKRIKNVANFFKYKKTGLSKQISMELKENLVQIMENQKPYLNSELRLDDLSDLLNSSRNHTSQVINEQFNLSFFDFINKYRIKDACKLLVDTDKKALNKTQIAYSVGFNNRTSFYKAFKKFTNQSPSSYSQSIVS